MEIRYCCEKMYMYLCWDEIQAMLKEQVLIYCPFCGAKITETRCYEENKK